VHIWFFLFFRVFRVFSRILHKIHICVFFRVRFQAVRVYNVFMF
jgi:hypothetical protein